ncbi:mediator of RNA polymerase II transcription subunit 33B-like [Phalaenopsis equestris]|uniref:mediator of RNA polymerase II transcription subunit 33B-like n=1 Tax=Phalaenopsis equestris TaxID=78828 RepID=UPI0009E604C1|nr:mediator of RNA polymerase II transcription subunit 33B-like [Phalaenopsis equestris]
MAGGISQATLPLPLAAFVSLTITYKLDKASERFLNLAGPALENLAASCPWPSMPIVAALWTQKVKRWSDFLIFSASRTWFLSVHELDEEGNSGGLVYSLGGYALAYFTLLCGMFAWGIDKTSPSKRRPRVIEAHMEFLASALDGKISLGCDLSLWRAYVSGFLGLVVECAASWVMEVNLGVVKRLSRGLRNWNQDELALALLRKRGVEAMGAAAEVILAVQW